MNEQNQAALQGLIDRWSKVPAANETDCGWVKLYHRSGAHVTIPLRGDPVSFREKIDALIGQGWLVTAPGLEVGEEKEQVGGVLRGGTEKDGIVTPFVLLYSTNDALSWSFLKVYLNKPADVEAFEYAAKMKLDLLPDYVGNDKPQRGGSLKTDKFIVAVAKPFGVVFKKNPRHDDTEAGKMKPSRLFVRWTDAKPAVSPDHVQGEDDSRIIEGWVVKWRDWIESLKGQDLVKDPARIEFFSETVLSDFPATPKKAQQKAWELIKQYAIGRGWKYLGDYKFVERGAV